MNKCETFLHSNISLNMACNAKFIRKNLYQSLENVEWRPANVLDSYTDVFV